MTETLTMGSEREVYVDPLASSGLNQVSWGAIFAGVPIALSTQFLLNLLGVGIGMAVLDPARADNPDASTFSVVGGVWFVVSGLLASFCGGYVASRMSGRPSSSTGGFHGLTTWAVTTLFIVYLLTTSAGGRLSGAFSSLSSVVSVRVRLSLPSRHPPRRPWQLQRIHFLPLSDRYGKQAVEQILKHFVLQPLRP